MAVQLDLLTRRKARRAPGASEFEVHCLLADTIRLSLTPGWTWWHTPNGGFRSTAEAGKFKRMGVRAGVADFLLVGPGGIIHALELKVPGQKPSEAQLLFLEEINRAGGKALWVVGFAEAIATLKAWGAVRVRL